MSCIAHKNTFVIDVIWGALDRHHSLCGHSEIIPLESIPAGHDLKIIKIKILRAHFQQFILTLQFLQDVGMCRVVCAWLVRITQPKEELNWVNEQPGAFSQLSLPSSCHLQHAVHLELKALCTKPCNCRPSISHFTDYSSGCSWRPQDEGESKCWGVDEEIKAGRDERAERKSLTLL